jgi:hypothetical protein
MAAHFMGNLFVQRRHRGASFIRSQMIDVRESDT